MDILFTILAVIILLPLVFQGLGMLLQIFLGGGIGLYALWSSIWDRETPLTAKEGAISGAVFAIAIFIIDVILYFICLLLNIRAYETISELNYWLNIIPLILFVLSLIRLKFKFGICFVAVENCLTVLLSLMLVSIFF